MDMMVITMSRTRSGDKRNQMNILLIGLDNAGKTTTVMNLLGKSSDLVVPTLGFSTIQMDPHRQYHVQVYDLGGGSKIRSIWTNYFALVHGIIFVVDSCDGHRFDQVRDNLVTLFSDSRIQGKPVLIFVNKQDVDEAYDEDEVVQLLGINQLANQFQSPTKIESISATTTTSPFTKRNKSRKRNKKSPKVPDVSSLQSGYNWLMERIILNWHVLNARVESEAEDQITRERMVMQERMARFKRPDDDEDDGHGHDDGKDPFKSIQDVAAQVEVHTKSIVTHIHGDGDGDRTIHLTPIEGPAIDGNGFIPSDRPRAHSIHNIQHKKRRKSGIRSNKVSPF